jgi:hypothetical protein
MTMNQSWRAILPEALSKWGIETASFVRYGMGRKRAGGVDPTSPQSFNQLNRDSTARHDTRQHGRCGRLARLLGQLTTY